MQADKDFSSLSKNFKKLTKKSEGEVVHLYLDTVGNPTIGKGHLVSHLKEAQKLPFYLKNNPEKKATAEQIKKEYEALKKLPFGPKIHAHKFQPQTSLILKEAAIQDIEDKDIDNAIRYLQRNFVNYHKFPHAAQLGLLDMAFNLGGNGLIEGFPKLVAAVKQEDWRRVRDECHRGRVQPDRNKLVKTLFQAAEFEKKYFLINQKYIPKNLAAQDKKTHMSAELEVLRTLNDSYLTSIASLACEFLKPSISHQAYYELRVQLGNRALRREWLAKIAAHDILGVIDAKFLGPSGYFIDAIVSLYDGEAVPGIAVRWAMEALVYPGMEIIVPIGLTTIGITASPLVVGGLATIGTLVIVDQYLWPKVSPYFNGEKPFPNLFSSNLYAGDMSGPSLATQQQKHLLEKTQSANLFPVHLESLSVEEISNNKFAILPTNKNMSLVFTPKVASADENDLRNSETLTQDSKKSSAHVSSLNHAQKKLSTHSRQEPTTESLGIDFSLSLVASPVSPLSSNFASKNNCSIAYTSGRGVHAVNGAQNIKISASLFELRNNHFAPGLVMACAIPLEITPFIMGLTGIGLMALVGGYGIKKYVEHQKWWNKLSAEEKAKYNLKTSISSYQKSIQKSWLHYLDPRSWGESQGEINRKITDSTFYTVENFLRDLGDQSHLDNFTYMSKHAYPELHSLLKKVNSDNIENILKKIGNFRNKRICKLASSALEKLENRDFKDIKPIAEKLMNADSKNPLSWLLYAKLAEEPMKHFYANQLYDKALSLTLDKQSRQYILEEKIFFNLRNKYVRRTDFFTDLDKAIESGSNHLRYDCAKLLLNEGEFDKAKYIYEVITADPLSSGDEKCLAYFFLGSLKEYEKKPDAACKHYINASQSLPSSPNITHECTKKLRELGENSEAYICAKRGVQLDQNNTEALLLAAKCALSIGEITEAEQTAEALTQDKFLENKNLQYQANKLLAKIQFAKPTDENSLAALQYYQTAEKYTANASKLIIKKANIHFKQQNFQAAFADYNRYLEICPNDLLVTYYQALTALALSEDTNDSDKAIQFINLAEEKFLLITQTKLMEPGAKEDKNINSELVSEPTKNELSIAGIDGESLNFTMSNAYRFLGKIAENKGKDPLPFLRNAIIIKADNYSAHNDMGLYFAKNEQYDSALKCFEQCLKNPNDKHARAKVALMLFEQGRTKEAYETLQQNPSENINKNSVDRVTVQYMDEKRIYETKRFVANIAFLLLQNGMQRLMTHSDSENIQRFGNTLSFLCDAGFKDYLLSAWDRAQFERLDDMKNIIKGTKDLKNPFESISTIDLIKTRIQKDFSEVTQQGKALWGTIWDPKMSLKAIKDGFNFKNISTTVDKTDTFLFFAGKASRALITYDLCPNFAKNSVKKFNAVLQPTQLVTSGIKACTKGYEGIIHIKGVRAAKGCGNFWLDAKPGFKKLGSAALIVMQVADIFLDKYLAAKFPLNETLQPDKEWLLLARGAMKTVTSFDMGLCFTVAGLIGGGPVTWGVVGGYALGRFIFTMIDLEEQTKLNNITWYIKHGKFQEADVELLYLERINKEEYSLDEVYLVRFKRIDYYLAKNCRIQAFDLAKRLELKLRNGWHKFNLLLWIENFYLSENYCDDGLRLLEFLENKYNKEHIISIEAIQLKMLRLRFLCKQEKKSEVLILAKQVEENLKNKKQYQSSLFDLNDFYIKENLLEQADQLLNFLENLHQANGPNINTETVYTKSQRIDYYIAQDNHADALSHIIALAAKLDKNSEFLNLLFELGLKKSKLIFILTGYKAAKDSLAELQTKFKDKKYEEILIQQKLTLQYLNIRQLYDAKKFNEAILVSSDVLREISCKLEEKFFKQANHQLVSLKLSALLQQFAQHMLDSTDQLVEMYHEINKFIDESQEIKCLKKEVEGVVLQKSLHAERWNFVITLTEKYIDQPHINKREALFHCAALLKNMEKLNCTVHEVTNNIEFIQMKAKVISLLQNVLAGDPSNISAIELLARVFELTEEYSNLLQLLTSLPHRLNTNLSENASAAASSETIEPKIMTEPELKLMADFADKCREMKNFMNLYKENIHQQFQELIWQKSKLLRSFEKLEKHSKDSLIVLANVKKIRVNLTIFQTDLTQWRAIFAKKDQYLLPGQLKESAYEETALELDSFLVKATARIEEYAMPQDSSTAAVVLDMK